MGETQFNRRLTDHSDVPQLTRRQIMYGIAQRTARERIPVSEQKRRDSDCANEEKFSHIYTLNQEVQQLLRYLAG